MTNINKSISKLLDNNLSWAKNQVDEDPDFFKRLSQIQTPDYLWIGCSDSRVPANEIVGLKPGELFVHRNVANVVVHSDLNCLSVMEFAINILKVKHIIVTGHYGCSGVGAALKSDSLGLVDNWLRHVRDVVKDNRVELAKIKNQKAKARRLCELNLQSQVFNVCSTSMVRNAWSVGQKLEVHGLIYDIRDGLLKDMNLHFKSLKEVKSHPASREV